MGLNLSPSMFIIVTGLAGIGCGYYTYRSIKNKDSWMRSGFWFMWCLGGLTGAAGEALRLYNQNEGLAKILDETFAVAVSLGLLLWILDWFGRNTKWLKKLW